MLSHLRLATAFLLLAAVPLAAGEKKKAVLPAVLPKVLTDLKAADVLELISLDPNVKQDEADDKRFHGWKVLGRVSLPPDTKKEKWRARVLTALFKGVKDSNGDVAKCFIPRHGIVATKGKHKVEAVICFQCLKMQFFVNDMPNDKMMATTANAGPLFNRILLDAKVKLPKQAK